MSQPAVSVRDLTKSFKVCPSPRARILEWMSMDFFHFSKNVHALQGVSFRLARGKALGIIGKNGSGKTTLLRILGGLSYPTKGSVELNGEAASIIDLGVGFHPDFTGKQNVFLNGALYGIDEDALRRRYTDIVDFADIGEAMNFPVRTYSQGMLMRLAFSLAIHVEPQILLIDEVMAVGDEAFQHKCLNKLQTMRRNGITVIVVSHALPLIRYFCDEALWLDEGLVREHGSPEAVIRAYRDNARGETSATGTPVSAGAHGERHGSYTAVIEHAEIQDAHGKPSENLLTGEPFSILVDYLAEEKIKRPTFGFAVHRNDGVHIWGFSTQGDHASPDFIEGRGRVRVSFECLGLLPGSYFLTVALLDEASLNAYDFHAQMYPFRVESSLPDEGIMTMPHRYSFELL